MIVDNGGILLRIFGELCCMVHTFFIGLEVSVGILRMHHTEGMTELTGTPW